MTTPNHSGIITNNTAPILLTLAKGFSPTPVISDKRRAPKVAHLPAVDAGSFFVGYTEAMSKLTPKQENFAQLYVELGSAAESYRRAYESKAKPETCQRSGHECLHHPKISARIEEIRDELAEKALWKRLNSVEVLSEVALNGEKDSDKVAAVKALNGMYGWDKQTIDHTSSDGTMSPRTPTELSDDELAAIAGSDKG